MSLINSIASWFMKKRVHQIELFMKYPLEVQDEWLKKLLKQAKDTEFGNRYGFEHINNYEQYKSLVPIQDYESLKHDIDRIRKGEQNILWPTEIKWFAKSSGTTNDKSKFIPVSPETLDGCHHNGGRDMVTLYCVNYPDTQLFTGKNLALGGSHNTDHFGNYESYHGDVSAIIMKHLPMWAEFFRAPNLNIALMNNWEEKLDALAKATMSENVTSIAGVPSWMLILIKRIFELSGKKSLSEIWPNLEVYFHGGVAIQPYYEQYQKLFNGLDVHFLELYSASEGFFGIQDDRHKKELLLMLDYGIYYEFIPVRELEQENPKVVNLEHVIIGETYAMLISNNSGLWRYKIGDLITFTSTSPFKFVISGRTQQYINVFGEELMIDNAEKALKIACEKTNSNVSEYTVAPVYMSHDKSGTHQWLIEFEDVPEDIAFFTEVLDNALKSVNSDYEAKRYNDYTIRKPEVIMLERNSFYNWLKSKDKLGGQFKVPRLSNDRKYIDQILLFVDQQSL
jgi:hypothetical protein